jgi:hypothetical protein
MISNPRKIVLPVNGGNGSRNKQNQCCSFFLTLQKAIRLSLLKLPLSRCCIVMLGNGLSTQRKQYHFTNGFLNYTIGSVGKTARYLRLLKTMGGALASIANL